MFRTISNFFRSLFASEENKPKDVIHSGSLSDEEKGDLRWIIEHKLKYGGQFAADSEAVQQLYESIESYNAGFYVTSSYIRDMLDPKNGCHVYARPIGDQRPIGIATMASDSGSDLVKLVVDAWIGSLDHIVSVEVSSHVTLFYAENGKQAVVFNGAGRKMHYNSTHRAYNAQCALSLLGIEASINDLAIQDLHGYYPSLVFERSATGEWTSHEHERAAA